MRTARRSLVFAFALMLSVVAAPAYAGDDSPGLLDTLGNTVDELTAPILPTPKPAPAPIAEQAPKPAESPTVVTALTDTLTGVTDTVAGTLHATPLAPALEPVLSAVAPSATAPEVVLPEVLVPEQDLRELIGSLDLLGGASAPFSRTSMLATNVDVLGLTSSLANDSDEDTFEAGAQTSHIPGTSTLPDGGSPLTATWLMLWAGVVAAGALIVRRSRTAS
ncbi:MAG: hypothetical protein ABIN55_07215 [Aeromicrobium sp.]